MDEFWRLWTLVLTLRELWEPLQRRYGRKPTRSSIYTSSCAASKRTRRWYDGAKHAERERGKLCQRRDMRQRMVCWHISEGHCTFAVSAGGGRRERWVMRLSGGSIIIAAPAAPPAAARCELCIPVLWQSRGVVQKCAGTLRHRNNVSHRYRCWAPTASPPPPILALAEQKARKRMAAVGPDWEQYSASAACRQQHSNVLRGMLVCVGDDWETVITQFIYYLLFIQLQKLLIYSWKLGTS